VSTYYDAKESLVSEKSLVWSSSEDIYSVKIGYYPFELIDLLVAGALLCYILIGSTNMSLFSPIPLIVAGFTDLAYLSFNYEV